MYWGLRDVTIFLMVSNDCNDLPQANESDERYKLQTQISLLLSREIEGLGVLLHFNILCYHVILLLVSDVRCYLQSPN